MEKLLPMKYTLFLITLFVLLLASSQNAAAYSDHKQAGASAHLVKDVQPEEDNRARILKAYLEQYDSPLASSAQTFVHAADKYGLDWRFVAAISGIESTFGHHIPYGSYNAWGWGVYGNKVTYFTSFDNGIQIISQSLRERYMDQWGATDVYGIGRIYAASPTWAQKVNYFMESIDAFEKRKLAATLSLAL